MKTSFKNVDWINILFGYIFCMSSIASFIKGLFLLIIGDSFFLESVITYCVLIILLCLSFNKIKKSISIWDLIYLIIFIIALSLSLLSFNDDINLVWDILKEIIRSCILCYLVGISIENYIELRKVLKIVAYVILIISIINILFLKTVFLVLNYSQDFGYKVLIASIIFAFELISEGKIRYLVAEICTLILILMSGSRGPLLSLILSLAILFFLFNVRNTVYNYFLTISIVVFGIIIYLNLQTLLIVLSSYFERFGVSQRVLNAFLSNSISVDSSRSSIARYVINYIKNDPITGSGLFNDRVLIFNNITFSSTQTYYGSYAHNFFLEILMQFGLVLGSLIIFLFFRLLYISIFKNIEKSSEYITVFMFCFGFLPLLVSRSYLTTKWFYMLIGVIIGVNRKKNIQ